VEELVVVVKRSEDWKREREGYSMHAADDDQLCYS
jgi:hypothetical protein